MYKVKSLSTGREQELPDTYDFTGSGYEKAGFTRVDDSPSSTPTKTEPINRPVYQNTPSPYEQARQDLYSRPERPSEMSIRQQEMEAARAQIEATKGVYQAELGKLQREGQERMGQTSSMAVGAGLAGTPFQQQQEIKTEEYTGQVIGARQAERASEISRYLTGGSQRAEQKYQARRQEFENERESYLGFIKEKQTSARDSIKSIASAGFTLDEMDDQEYRTLLEDSGLSDFEAKAYAMANSPQANAQYEKVGDKLVGYYINPSTGKFESFESDSIPALQEAQSATIETYDGVPYILKQDADGNLVGEVLPGFKEQKDLEYKTGSKYQPAGYFDPQTGQFTRLGGGTYGGGGTASISSSDGSGGTKATGGGSNFDEWLKAKQDKDKMTYNIGDAKVKSELEAQYQAESQIAMSNIDETTNQMTDQYMNNLSKSARNKLIEKGVDPYERNSVQAYLSRTAEGGKVDDGEKSSEGNDVESIMAKYGLSSNK